ncbi:hypothetical protein J4476_02860 [Candidatus Woesearchaeota archaeon]|nr:MAG: hypothetical protein QT09_C0005G0063 [archaeon GW2011_AR18]MBS3161609.1 hypothetical protein [Candidatus Woesearchaeota archaeon]HIH26201.1 hypothetical protein [Nanoarchaeota archaeon]
MKIYYFLILLLIIPIVNADIEYKVYKDNYSPLETLQGEILIINVTLNRDLTTNNIKLYDNNENNILLSKNFLKINNTYFFYFDLPQTSGEYNLVLNDFYYTKDGIITKGEIKKQIIIVNSSNSVSIKPGFYYNKLKSYEETKFTITIKNNGNNTENFEIIDNEYIRVNFKKFNIGSKQVKIIEANTNLFNKKESNINKELEIKYTTGNYKIPIIIERTGINIIENNTTIINDTKISVISYDNALILNDEFGAELPLIKLRSNTNVTSYANLSLKNKLNIKITDINVKLTNNLGDVVQVYPIIIDEINSKDERSILITVNKNKNLEKNYTGNIEFKSKEGATLSIPFTIILNNPKTTTIQDNTPQSNTLKNNTLVIQPKKDKNTYFWIYVIVFFLLIILLIFYVYKKGKPKEKEFNEFIDRVKNRQ